MRAVLDTNVLISALIWPRGIPAQVVGLTRQGHIRSVISPALLEEFRRVLREKMGFQSEPIETAVEVVVEHSDIITPRHTIRAIEVDPDDNRVLECAVEGEADAIATGDHHLLELKNFRGILILTPREILRTLFL